MKTNDVQLKPNQDLSDVLAEELAIDRRELLGILPVQKYLAVDLKEQGFVLALASRTTGMSVLISHDVIPDLIKVLQNALDDNTN